MAWQRTDELIDGRSCSSDKSGQKSYARKFRVICEDGDGVETARLGTGVPREGDVHPENSAAICQAVKVEQAENDDFAWVFIASAEYSTLIIGPPEPPDNNPLLRPAEIVWGEEFLQVPLTRAWVVKPDGTEVIRPVVSSSFEAFDPPPVMDRTIRVATITRNEASFDPIAIDLTYKNKVNKYAIGRYPIGSILLASVVGTRNYENGIYYWAVTYVFKIDLELLHAAVTLDQGVFKLVSDGSSVRREAIIDELTSSQVTEPVLLDGHGQPLALPSTQAEIENFQGVYQLYYPYSMVDFGPLNLL